MGLELSEWEGIGDWRLFFLRRDQWRKLTPADVDRVAVAYFKSANAKLLPEADGWKKLAESFTVRQVYSPERLLDQAALIADMKRFLDHVIAQDADWLLRGRGPACTPDAHRLY